MEQIILASGSPRRKKLVERLGIDFEVCPSQIDEDQVNESRPEVLVKVLARLKAQEVADRKEGIIIAADTVVSLHQEVLGKPATEKEAYAMLKKLSGSEHQVTTGITVISNSQEITDYQQTTVQFREIDDQEINQYIATGEPMDKAGAYGIQAKGAIFVTGINGCFYNVMGMPLAWLVERLKELGIAIKLNG
mgnify:CR=1 FL=1